MVMTPEVNIIELLFVLIIFIVIDPGNYFRT
jgi:hypothetical protein